MAGHFISSTPSLALLSSPATSRTWTFGWGKPTDISGTDRPSGWGPNTIGPPSVVPYAFVMAACGRVLFSDDIKFWLTGECDRAVPRSNSGGVTGHARLSASPRPKY